MNKGGKFIFEKSLIRDDLTIHLPTQALKLSDRRGRICQIQKAVLDKYFKEWGNSS